MAITVRCARDSVTVELSGWDRLMSWRRSLVIDLAAVRSAAIEQRSALEAGIDHRVSGVGTHDGGKRSGRRRVGTMLGRAVDGHQFWAVSAGAATDRLLVLDLSTGSFVRVVVDATPDVEARVSSRLRTH